VDPEPFSAGRLSAGSVVSLPASSSAAAELEVSDADGDALGDDDAAVTDTLASASGSVFTSVAAAFAVSLTEVTELAEDATVIWAWSWRVADVESTVPTSQAAVPSLLPQPRANFAFCDEGVAASLRVTSEAEPSVVHTLTT
jgi:hypothetical protein